MESKSENTILFCEFDPEKSNSKDQKSKDMDIGRQGIKRRSFHRIVRLEEVSGKEFRFVQIRNFWGIDSNWVGAFSPNSNEWEKFKDVKQALQERTGEIIK